MDTGLSAGLHLGGRQKWVFDLTCIKISDAHNHQTAIMIFAKDTSSDVAVYISIFQKNFLTDSWVWKR